MDLQKVFILSEAKDHLALLDPRKVILRFAPNDKIWRSLSCSSRRLKGKGFWLLTTD